MPTVAIAETPEKLKRLESLLGGHIETKQRLFGQVAFWKDQAELREKRLAELDQLREADNRELKRLERMIAEADKRHEETLQAWNKQIAEAPERLKRLEASWPVYTSYGLIPPGKSLVDNKDVNAANQAYERLAELERMIAEDAEDLQDAELALEDIKQHGSVPLAEVIKDFEI